MNGTGSMAILNIGSYNTYVFDHELGTNNFSYNDTFGDFHFKAEQKSYYLEASMELLDGPEEWFNDKESKVLYLIPPKRKECANTDTLRGRT